MKADRRWWNDGRLTALCTQQSVIAPDGRLLVALVDDVWRHPNGGRDILFLYARFERAPGYNGVVTF